MTKIKGAIDITEIWTNKSKNGFVKYLHSYTYHGEIYKVDNFHVVLKPSKEEIEIAELLENKYGKRVLLVPRISFPHNIQTPDYFINNHKYDLKSPTGNSKSTLINLTIKKKNQAKNFIFCLDKTKLSNTDDENQLEVIFNHKLTNFVQTIILIKSSTIMKVYKRKTR